MSNASQQELIQSCIPQKDVLERLGKGTYGLVYKVREGGKTYALKTYVNDAFDSSNIIEIDTLVRVNHPNVVNTHKAYVNDRCDVCLLLELADSDLDAYIRNTPAGPSLDKEKIMFGLACGLRYLHANFIVHKDLKPANILMKDGVPKIADFGLATVRHTHEIPLDGPVATVWWRPPEILVTELAVPGRRYAYSSKVDVWAMGLIFYQLIAGKRLLQCTAGKGRVCEEDMLYQISRRIEPLPEWLIEIVNPDAPVTPGLVDNPREEEIAGELFAYTTVAARAATIAKRDSYFAGVPPIWKALILDTLRTDPEQRIDSEDLVKSVAFNRVASVGAVCAAGTIDSRPMDIKPAKQWLRMRKDVLSEIFKRVYKSRVAFFLCVDILDRFFTVNVLPKNKPGDLCEAAWYLAASLYGEDTDIFPFNSDVVCEIVRSLKFKLFRPTINMVSEGTVNGVALAICYINHVAPDQVKACASTPETADAAIAFRLEHGYLRDYSRALDMLDDGIGSEESVDQAIISLIAFLKVNKISRRRLEHFVKLTSNPVEVRGILDDLFEDETNYDLVKEYLT